MQEFIYYNKDGIDFPLPETIFVTQTLTDIPHNEYIVSNSKATNAELIADEIDFYIKNSQDSLADKIKNVEKLYEINATKFDNAKDMFFKEEISNSVLLVCENEQKSEVLKAMVPDEFNLFHITADIIKDLEGKIGNLTVTIEDGEEDVQLNVSQIIWYNKKDIACKFSGIFDPTEIELNDVLAQVRMNITNYEYRKVIAYDSSICQYHERREEVCGRCEAVCPTNAITKIDSSKHLEFSHVDCTNCGECFSVCPSGSLEYTPQGKESIYHTSDFYKDTHPLIIPSKMDIKNLNVSTKEKVLPFVLDTSLFLDESSLLTIVQMSGSQVVIYNSDFSDSVTNSIQIINDIYQAKFQKDAILIAKDEEELKLRLEEVSFVENSYVNYNQQGQRKREIFSSRLEKLVGENDFGTVKTGEFVHYGKVKVNEATCTLCLSCVGACNVSALTANAEDNTLRLNASICTACGYCEASCPEADCLTIERDVIELKPTWFKEEILAKDTLFACVECGKEFATTKAVEKIANMMGPIFASNPTKQRTLYCCEDCKAKLMIKQGLLDA